MPSGLQVKGRKKARERVGQKGDIEGDLELGGKGKGGLGYLCKMEAVGKGWRERGDDLKRFHLSSLSLEHILNRQLSSPNHQKESTLISILGFNDMRDSKRRRQGGGVEEDLKTHAVLSEPFPFMLRDRSSTRGIPGAAHHLGLVSVPSDVLCNSQRKEVEEGASQSLAPGST